MTPARTNAAYRQLSSAIVSDTPPGFPYILPPLLKDLLIDIHNPYRSVCTCTCTSKKPETHISTGTRKGNKEAQLPLSHLAVSS